MIEKQIKFKINNYNNFLNFLREKGAVFIGSAFEITKRYDNEREELTKKNIYIRTRSGFKNVLTIKEKTTANLNLNKYFERKTVEIEVEDLEKLSYALEIFGLKPILRMEKYRMIWKLNDIIFNIDELPFGVYLEIRGDDLPIEKILKLFNFQENQIIADTYWDIFKDLQNKNNYPNKKDIIFDKDFSFKICKL